MPLTKDEFKKMCYEGAVETGFAAAFNERVQELRSYGFEVIEVNYLTGDIGVPIPKTVKEHHDNVRALGCIISGRTPATIHHCHGGSLKWRGFHVGMAQKQNEALVIPLHLDYHVGKFGIDSGIGVERWETEYGTQAGMLDEVSRRLGYDVWKLAEMWKPESKILPRGMV